MTMSNFSTSELSSKAVRNKNARIELKTSPDVKGILEQAANFKGVSLTAFILAIAEKEASQVIESRKVSRLDEDAWLALEEAMKPRKSTKALRELMRMR